MRAEDQPSRTPPGVAALMLRAHGIGTAAGAIADAIYADNCVAGVRCVLGLCMPPADHGRLTIARTVALDAEHDVAIEVTMFDQLGSSRSCTAWLPWADAN